MNMMTKRLSTLFLSLAPLTLAGAQTLAQTCTVSAGPGVPATDLNRSIAVQDGPGKQNEPSGGPGWTGADSTYSIKLPNGDTAFFYSDSYIGEWPPLSGDGSVSTDANGLRTRAVNCGPPLCNPPTSLFRAHNSIVIRNASTGSLTTLSGSRDAFGFSTSYFHPTNPDHWYWMGDSIVVQVNTTGARKLWTFLLEYDASYTFYGAAIAQMSLPGLAIETIQPLNNIPPGSTTVWGVSLWMDGNFGNNYLYVYGKGSPDGTNKRPYVALTNPILGLSGVADTNNWYVWDGSQWALGLSNAAPIIGATNDPRNAGDSISDEYSVKKIRSSAGTTYLLVAQDTKPAYGLWKDIVIYSACNPQGPFSARQVVYSTPETGATKVPGMNASQNLTAGMLTYNPHSHPQFTTNGNLVISYNVNAGASADLLYADTYRPRFIRIPILGLLP
ncbi:MAG: hypothetical protein J2P31_00620 [Blastocatellia bacterium]|nr:hypothetical protein [Blastocatellia bacterium]